MLNEPTLAKLKALRRDALAAAWLEQQKKPEVGKLGFDERLGLLVDAEWLARENARFRRMHKEAKLKYPEACVEDVDYSAKRELEKAVIRQLATCGWVAEHHNIAIVGAAGTGKSWIGCALAQQAMRRGYRAVYRRAPRFFDHEIVLAHADGTYGNLLSRIARIDVLILDDWALAAASERERRDLLEILEDRQGLRSTIITSQLPTDRWHAHVGDPMLADAICDRFLSRAHRIALKGPSRRPPLARDGEKK